LLELFSSPDALVRELSLRILHATAGRQSTAALVKLLGDPEPNVRAAVLKQLADQPTPGMVSQLAAYIQQEPDADLVVHAVRALRAVDSQESLDALRPLTKHAAWRVRAEAAQAIGEAVTNSRRAVTEPQKATAFATLVETLEDSDGFVVSRAIAAFKKGDRREAVEPMAKLVDRAEPLLAAQAVKALNTGGNTREAALPHLRRFCSHKEPAVRAAAIKELCGPLYVNVNVKTELIAALKDSASQVRTAGADALFQMLNSHRPTPDDEVIQSIDLPVPVPIPPPQPAMKASGFFDGLTGLFGGRSDPPPVTQPPPANFTPPSQPPADPDKALEELRSGKGRAKWMNDLPPLLEPMLSATDPEERLAAALALIALGREDRALPVVLEVAAKVRASRGKAGGVLPWLLWAKREDVYKKLVATDVDPEQLQDIVNGLTSPRDKRTLPLLWSVTARPGLTNDLLYVLSNKVQETYFGNELYSRVNGVRPLKPDDVKQAVAEAKPKSESGPEHQRLIALAVLLAADPDAAKAAAEKVVADESASAGLRRDAFQIGLAATKQADRRAAETEGLKHKFAGARRVSILALAQGDGGLSYLPDRGMHLDQANGGGLAPANAKEVSAELLRPLVGDTDPQTAAAAGFLLALAGEPDGFDALAHYWREFAPKDDAWARMLVRAAATLGDDGRVPVLEEVYVQLPAIGLTPAEFATIIRPMTGPAARRLRSQISRDAGANPAVLP
jgi:HEAT repeat protein